MTLHPSTKFRAIHLPQSWDIGLNAKLGLFNSKNFDQSSNLHTKAILIIWKEIKNCSMIAIYGMKFKSLFFTKLYSLRRSDVSELNFVSSNCVTRKKKHKSLEGTLFITVVNFCERPGKDCCCYRKTLTSLKKFDCRSVILVCLKRSC